MDNPEIAHHTIDTATMYHYQHGTNIPWTQKQYHTPKCQMNVELQIKKRKWLSQKKGQKDKHYVTKRGFYMDYDLKVAKGVPSATAHGQQKEWDFQGLKKKGINNKVDPKLSKYTYLDQIQTEQKNRKCPGISTYRLEKSLKEKELEIEKLKKKPVAKDVQKPVFFQNTERLSEGVPGAGQYCPHLPSPKERLNKTDYKFWVGKHKEQSKRGQNKSAAVPSPCSHSPMNKTLSTFDRIAEDNKKSDKKKHFGGDSRFDYTRPQKRKTIDKIPAPSAYNTMLQWRSKAMSPKKALWNDMVWRGQSNTVYH